MTDPRQVTPPHERSTAGSPAGTGTTAASPAGTGTTAASPAATGTTAAASPGGAGTTAANPGPADPLRLCVFATVALLGWLLGPWALLGFASLAVVGYARARRAGLLRSRCKLGDTRLVLAYLVLLAAGAGTAIVLSLT